MYRILNPMNHNVALVRNEKGKELVIVGKGIIFGKKKGDFIPKEKAEKVFRMKTEESKLCESSQRCSAGFHHCDLRSD